MNLFIDDERFPPDNGEVWEIARNLSQVKALIHAGHYPTFISFDHDLGENEQNGLQVAQWLIQYDMDHNVLPPELDWYTHSQNPVGRDAINSFMKSAVSNLEKFNRG